MAGRRERVRGLHQVGRWRRTVLLALAGALSVTSGAIVPVARVGALDGAPADGAPLPGFGQDGVVRLDLGRSENPVFAMTVDAQGRPLLAGSVRTDRNLDAFVARFDATGGLDPTFGKGGVASFGMGRGNRREFEDDVAGAIAVDPQGRTVVAGWTLGGPVAGPGIALVRLGPDGTLDGTFGRGGRVMTRILGAATDVAIGPDGSIVVVGSAGSDVVLARFTDDGDPVRGFGRRGVAVDDWGTNQDYPGGLALEPDGDIAVAGFALASSSPVRWQPIVARYTPKGRPDGSFGRRGLVRPDLPDGGRLMDLLVDDAGGVIAVGSQDNPGGTPAAILALRILDDGMPDPTFGDGGMAVLDLGPTTFDGATAVARDALGRLLLAGYTGQGGKDQALLARLEATGAPDPSFGDGGTVRTEFAGNAFALDVASRPDGSVVTGGRTAVDGPRGRTDIGFLVAVEGTGGTPPPADVHDLVASVRTELGAARTAHAARDPAATSTALDAAVERKLAIVDGFGEVCGAPARTWYEDLYALDLGLWWIIDKGRGSDADRPAQLDELWQRAEAVRERLEAGPCLTDAAARDLTDILDHLDLAAGTAATILDEPEADQQNLARRRSLLADLDAARAAKAHLLCEARAFPPIGDLLFCEAFLALEAVDQPIDEARFQLPRGPAFAGDAAAAIGRAESSAADLDWTLRGAEPVAAAASASDLLAGLDTVAESLVAADAALSSGDVVAARQALASGRDGKLTAIGRSLGRLCGVPALAWYLLVADVQRLIHEWVDQGRRTNRELPALIARIRARVAGLLEHLERSGCLSPAAAERVAGMLDHLGLAALTARGLIDEPGDLNASIVGRRSIAADLDAVRAALEALLCEDRALPDVADRTACAWFTGLVEADEGIDDARWHLTAGLAFRDEARADIDRARRALAALRGTATR